MPVTRRTLLGLISGSSFYFSTSTGALSALADRDGLSAARFAQGVASADPRPDAVMLWTRAEPASGAAARVQLLLEVSRDEAFENVVLRRHLSAASDVDYTVRAHIADLEPDTFYFYHFIGGADTASRTGRTRTAPAPDRARPVNVAFVSCQDYENAHYGSWARMLADDRAAPGSERIDFVLHLGDFIYERSWHRRRDGSAKARRVPPFPDGVETDKNRYAVSLADYRHLYRTYLEDPHLQAARARWPFVCTWDDHEFSNNCFQSYSTYGGEYVLEPQRRIRANQAWFEFIPAMLDELTEQPAHGFAPPPDMAAANNLEAVDSLRIYRKLSWGRHLDIVLTDTRSYRSPPALPEGFAESLNLPLATIDLVEIADAGRDYAGGNPPALLPYGSDVANPGRERAPGSILGAPQRNWFLETLDKSTAHWKLWGNSLPLIPMRLDLSTLPFTVYEDSIFTIDPWAGYPHEVRNLMDALREAGVSGLVSFSGDHHMHGAGTVSRSPGEPEAPPVLADFTVAGISSAPIFEDLLAVARDNYGNFSTLVYRETGEKLEPVWNMSLLDGVLAAYLYAKTGIRTMARWFGPNEANPGLRYVDTTANGYGLARFDAEELTVRHITMEDCRPAFEVPPGIRHIATLRVARWEADGSPTIEGPTFAGGAPFPFDVDDA